MGIIERTRAALQAFSRPTVNLNEPELLEWLGIDGKNRKEMNEVTYFTCMKMLVETMGKLPLKFYQKTGKGKIRAEPTDAGRMLMTRPNKIMTPAIFWGTVEYNCEHYGNAYVWIQRQFVKHGRFGGEYKTLGYWIMQSHCVEVLMDNAGIFGNAGNLYYRYTDPHTGTSYVFRESEVMHFKTWCTRDGILGKSVREMLFDTVEGAGESQNYLNELYRGGLTASMALQYTQDIDQQRRRALQKEYNKMFTGAKNAGKIVAVPVGMNLVPLNIKLADAQFFELKKYTALQIAGAFGIKPNQINDYEKSSYANSETQQLAFLVDTMLYRLSMYEQEINYKCLTEEEQKQGYYFKFNEKAILRTDSQTQMTTIVSAVTNGLYSINEGREYLDKPRVEGGDVNMVNGTYTPITAIGAAYGINSIDEEEKAEETADTSAEGGEEDAG